jgi:hypothetical protein
MFKCNVCNKNFVDYFQFIGHLNIKGHNEKVFEYLQNDNLPIDIIHDQDRLSIIELKLDKLLAQPKNIKPVNIITPIISNDADLEEKEYFIAKCFINTGYYPFDLKNKMYKIELPDNTIYDYNGYYFTKFYHNIYLTIKDRIPEHLSDYYKKALILFDINSEIQKNIMVAYYSLIVPNDYTPWESGNS